MTAEVIAKAFALDFKNNVSGDQFQEMRYRNSTPQYAGHACATHDFLDANECMEFAFNQVVGRGPNPSSDDDAALWSKAWGIAKAEYLTATAEEAHAWDSALFAYGYDAEETHRQRGSEVNLPDMPDGAILSFQGFHRSPR